MWGRRQCFTASQARQYSVSFREVSYVDTDSMKIKVLEAAPVSQCYAFSTLGGLRGPPYNRAKSNARLRLRASTNISGSNPGSSDVRGGTCLRQLPERVHLPFAAGEISGVSALRVSELRKADCFL